MPGRLPSAALPNRAGADAPRSGSESCMPAGKARTAALRQPGGVSLLDHARFLASEQARTSLPGVRAGPTRTSSVPSCTAPGFISLTAAGAPTAGCRAGHRYYSRPRAPGRRESIFGVVKPQDE